MNIGIVVFSQTGNTRLVGERLKETLEDRGHQATLHQINAGAQEETGDQGVDAVDTPATQEYEALVFGSPVHGFSIPPDMQNYLKQVAALNGKPVACFVTKQLPFAWTGGSQALARMKQLCQGHGGRVVGDTVVYWNRSPRDEHIRQCVDHLAALL